MDGQKEGERQNVEEMDKGRGVVGCTGDAGQWEQELGG